VVPVADDTGRARELIARARAIRQAAGITLPAMAAECDVTKSTMSRWERDMPPDPARPAWQGAAVNAQHWVAILAVLDATNSRWGR
jgi:transcriptional regulator with XRE-family HTH domain